MKELLLALPAGRETGGRRCGLTPAHMAYRIGAGPMKAWRDDLSAHGVTLFVLSNNRHESRPRIFSQALDVPYIGRFPPSTSVNTWSPMMAVCSLVTPIRSMAFKKEAVLGLPAWPI